MDPRGPAEGPRDPPADPAQPSGTVSFSNGSWFSHWARGPKPSPDRPAMTDGVGRCYLELFCAHLVSLCIIVCVRMQIGGGVGDGTASECGH